MLFKQVNMDHKESLACFTSVITILIQVLNRRRFFSFFNTCKQKLLHVTLTVLALAN